MRTTAVYELRERNSLTPTTTVIPAKAGIHCGGSSLLRSGAIYSITYEANFLANIMRWSLVEENGSPSKPP
jgi:hypothetical protein